jgi:hypothetical protein
MALQVRRPPFPLIGHLPRVRDPRACDLPVNGRAAAEAAGDLGHAGRRSGDIDASRPALVMAGQVVLGSKR